MIRTHCKSLLTVAAMIIVAVASLTDSRGVGGALPNDELPEELRALIKLRAEDDHPGLNGGKYKSEFFGTLVKLAESQGVKKEEYLHSHWGIQPLSGLVGGGPLTDGQATTVTSKKTYVVLTLTTQPGGKPSVAFQQLVLLDQNGRYLDKVACAINNRYGSINTLIMKEKAKDDAQLVIRLSPWSKKHPWHNWHTIAYQGKAFTTYADEDEPQPSEWITQGLCRIAIRDDKFAVVWPKLGKSDAEVLKEKAGK